MQLESSNPFSVLSNKKSRQDAPRPKEKKPEKTEVKPKEAAAKKPEPKKKDEGPKKESKVVSLAEAAKQEEAHRMQKELEKVEKEQKQEMKKMDRHDRTGKAHDVRKGGKGTGGWDDIKVEQEITEEVLEEETGDDKKERKREEKEEKAEVKELSAAELKAREEEARLREIEEKQITFEEYLEKQKDNAPPSAAFSIRTVDTSKFKGMVAKEKEKGEEKFKIGAAEKARKEPKKDEKKKKEEDKKEKVLVDVGFRMENPARQGKGKGEGKGGKGGKGRGGYQSKEETIQVDDEKLFPALGGAKAADAPVEST